MVAGISGQGTVAGVERVKDGSTSALQGLHFDSPECQYDGDGCG